MDYQTLFETGQLTPMQLRAWMDEDPVNAGRALRQRPELQEGLNEALLMGSTSPERNRPVSAYDQIGDIREDIFGVDSDDGFLMRTAKGLGDAVASPIALGAAGADYLKAGFNELTGNEEGLQWEDTPDAQDLVGDIFNTGLAAATGGAGNVLKAGFGNLAKNGLKNTLGKAKGKVLGSSTGKMLLGGPKRRLATGIGAASLLGGPEEDAGEGVVDDIINTPPKAPKESISSADLDAPITNPVTGRQSPVSLDTPSSNVQAAAPMQQAPDLSNPAGLAAMSNSLGNFRPIDPKDKSLEAFQRRGIQRDLNAQAARKVRQDIANQRREDNISDLANSMDQQIREAWLRSPSNKAGVPFEQLSPADQMKMRENYMASRRAGSYNSADDAAEIRNRKMLNDLDRSGGYAVNYRDPENKRNLPGQISTKDAQNRIIQKPYTPGKQSAFDSLEEASDQTSEKTLDNPFYINDWGPAAMLLATGLASRGRVKPKLKNLNQKQLTYKSPKVQKPQLENKPLRLENKRPYQLENKPLRLENNRPYQLENRVATPEQVRKMQTGMGSSERAADKYARLRESMAERGFITDGLF
jgi:hypothetical protein